MTDPTSHLESDQPVVEISGLTKSFRRFQALHDITVSVPRGVTGLLGPNGAGKSTLIKILLGLLQRTSGSGHVLGIPLGQDSQKLRERIGYMPEDDCYIPSLSGIESVQFAARLCRIPPVEALRRSHEILDFCGTGQERYRLVETYSTGMRQKLKFAQALVHDPELLILDEPTSGLDPDEREAMLARIQLLAASHGKSVLICTHILPDVQQVSDHVVILAAGRVAKSNSIDELSKPDRPATRVRTVGSPVELQAGLGELGITSELDNLGWLIVDGIDEATLSGIWQVAAKDSITIRSIMPATNSMETVFLNAVRQANAPPTTFGMGNVTTPKPAPKTEGSYADS